MVRAMEDVARDTRYAIRSLAGDKSFVTAALATLALGIGATTAIFSLVNSVVLKPLPFAQPDSLVVMYGTPAVRGEAVGGLDMLRSQSTAFDALVGYNISARYLQSSEGPERVMTVSAEREFFSMLGVPPLAGRVFRRDDPLTVAVVSETFWKRALGGRASAIGETLALNDSAFTLIGIMPDSFQFPYGAASVLHSVAPQARTDLWIPFDPPTDPALRGGRFAYVPGRLKPEGSIQQAENELAVISNRMASEDPDGDRGRGVRLEPLSQAIVARPLRRSLFVLFASVVIVLALACANVANLSFARMTRRSREAGGARRAGADRCGWSVSFCREFSVVRRGYWPGAACGGHAVVDWTRQRPVTHARGRLRSAGVWFSVLRLRSCKVLTGIMPAAVASGTDTYRILQMAGSHATMGGGLRRLRDTLVVAEIALALLLTAGAASLVRELVRLRHTDTGMVTSNVVTFHLLQRPPSEGVVRRGPPPEADTRPFYDIADRVRQIPGVRAAGFTRFCRCKTGAGPRNSIDFTSWKPPPPAPPFTFDLRYVTPGYFEALGVPIRRGRGFLSSDRRDVPPVIVVNEALARRVFQDDDPVGQLTTRGTIVGVAGDVRNANLDQETLPELYYPISQSWSQLSELGMTLVVRTVGPPTAVVDAVRAVVRAVNPDEAIFDVKTMDRIVEESIRPSRCTEVDGDVCCAALALAHGNTG
jgi:predicted permease